MLKQVQHDGPGQKALSYTPENEQAPLINTPDEAEERAGQAVAAEDSNRSKPDGRLQSR